jgi:hypothetical protein
MNALLQFMLIKNGLHSTVHTAGLAPSVRKILSPLAWKPSRAAMPTAISSRKLFIP